MIDLENPAVKDFLETFKDKLSQSVRYPAFALLIQELSKRENPLIVETGTARWKDNWIGDGQTTLIWDWYISKYGGEAWSVDIDLKYVENASSQISKVHCVCSDSISFLRRFAEPERIDLLFLDSYDWGDTLKERSLSELHHIGELACVYERLRPGTIIAVDDCHSYDMGKHVMVRTFFDRLGCYPIYPDYIGIWIKPDIQI